MRIKTNCSIDKARFVLRYEGGDFFYKVYFCVCGHLCVWVLGPCLTFSIFMSIMLRNVHININVACLKLALWLLMLAEFQILSCNIFNWVENKTDYSKMSLYFIACPNRACYYKLCVCLSIFFSRLGNWDLNFNLIGTLIRL